MDTIQAYAEIEPLCGRIFHKFPTAKNLWQGIEELRNDYILYFLQKKYGEKYNPSKSPIQVYLWTGLRNFVINSIFKKRVGEVSIDTYVGDGNTFKDIFAGDMDSSYLEAIKREILDTLPDDGRSPSIEHEGEILKFGYRSIFKLVMEGYKKCEIAEMFGVTAARVGQIVKEGQEILEKFYVS